MSGCFTSLADVGREAVYAAEDAAFGGTDFDAVRRLDELGALAAAVSAGSWWRSCDAPAVDVVHARTGTASSSARGGLRHRVVVRLAAGQLTAATLAHELGHALAGVGHGHDGRFRAAHVDVVAMVGGGAAAAVLRRCYADHGVPPAARPWPPPERGRGAGFVIVP